MRRLARAGVVGYIVDVAESRRGTRRPGWSTAAQEVVDRLFVYGSLRKGQTARSLIAEYITRSERATMAGALYALPDGYPVIVPGDGEVIGELLHLSDLTAALPLLDAYEGDSYERSMHQAILAGGTPVWTWVYTLGPAGSLANAVHIPSGDWDLFVTENLT